MLFLRILRRRSGGSAKRTAWRILSPIQVPSFNVCQETSLRKLEHLEIQIVTWITSKSSVASDLEWKAGMSARIMSVNIPFC